MTKNEDRIEAARGEESGGQGGSAAQGVPGWPAVADQRAPPAGNRGGRPRGSKGLKKIIEEIAFETHVITDDGKRTRRSTIDLVAMVLRRHAMSGNIKAIRAAHDYLQRFGVKEPDKQGGFLVVHEPPKTEEEYFKKLAEQQRKYRERSSRPGSK